MKVLITGASGGIGRECVKHLTSSGDHVIYAISRSADLLDSLKKECMDSYAREVHVLSVDFHQEGFQNQVAAWIGEMGGQLDILINNAGSLINKSFQEVNFLDIREQFRVNFDAPFVLTQSLIKYLKHDHTPSHVVNIGSMGGYMSSVKFPGLSVYSASKGALAILTECLAEEYKESNIRFNCLALGSADTEMLRKAFPAYQSPMSAEKMASYIVDFALNGHEYFNGKVLPVATLST